MPHEALTEQAQEIDRHDEHDDMCGERHPERRHPQPDEDARAQNPDTKTVRERAGKDHGRRRSHCRDGIKAAPAAMRQAEIFPDLTGEDRDEEGLAEA